MNTEAGISSIMPLLCSNCGYSLQGLPAAGLCPECGEGYDDQAIVLWGNGSASRERKHWRVWAFLKFGMFVAILATPFLVMHVVWTLEFSKHSMYSWLPIVLINMFIWLKLGMRFLQNRRGFSKPPQPVQAMFSAAGFGQRNGFGPVVLRSWNGQRLKAHILRRYGCCVITDGRVFGSIFMFRFKAAPEQIAEVVTRIESLAITHDATFRRYPERRDIE